MKYIAFDVETPNRFCDRMSAIGITVVENGAITEEYYSLVDPETHFDRFNIRLTGINEYAVKDAPTFGQLWRQIEPILSGGILVAHNAVFDLGVLKRCLCDYDIFWRERVRFICTVQTGRRLLPNMSHKLNVMCDYYGIPLDHHHAASDSRACAQILLKYMEQGAELRNYIRTYTL